MNGAGNKDAVFAKKYTEMITPHRFTIAVLIRSYNCFRETNEFRKMEDECLKARFRRDFCVLTLKLIQSPDLTLEELRNLLGSSKYKVHKKVITAFDTTLSELYENGTGHLLDIVDSFNRIMNYNESSPTDHTKSLINKNCVIGFFLRRLILNFDKLTFSEVTGVFLAFQRYYEEYQKSFELRHQLSTAAENANKIVYSEDWCADRDQWSRRHAELFIATQAALLTNNEEKALKPKEMQSRIRNVLKTNPDLSEAHFLSYLNYLRVKEFCGAIDSLYHSFDRGTIAENKTTVDEKSKGYRFAALNLAVLHYHFGHKEEALASLKEAIKKSQQANDNVCLQHALSWLYRLKITNKEKLIEHSILKSFELSLSYTTSLGIQTIVQHACLTSGPPFQIFETLTKSDIINFQHYHKDLISNSYAVKACLWQFYGKTEMCSLWSQLLLYLNIDNTSPSKSYYGEVFCLAICNVANILLVQGEYRIVNSILNFAKERFPNEPNSHIWMLCENLVMFTRTLLHENWNGAESAAQKIMVVDKWEGYLRLAELYLYKQDYVEANRCINILMEHYENEEKYKFKTHYYFRAEILLAEIQYASSYPGTVPPGVMTLLNNCLMETKKQKLDYYTALIYLHIANIQLLMGMTAQALKVLDKCLIQVLAHAGNYDRARAMLLYVKCLVANSSNFDVEKRKQIILNCTKILGTVKENFQKVEAYSRVKDVLYLQAQLYNNINMKTERNKCSLEYRLLDEEHKTKNTFTLVKYL